MSTEFAIFSDEGFMEGDFYSIAEAEAGIEAHYNEGDGCYVAEVCPEHREQEKGHCDTCDAEESDDNA